MAETPLLAIIGAATAAFVALAIGASRFVETWLRSRPRRVALTQLIGAVRTETIMNVDGAPQELRVRTESAGASVQIATAAPPADVEKHLTWISALVSFALSILSGVVASLIVHFTGLLCT